MRSAATRAPLNFSASCSCLVLSRSSSEASWAACARLSEMGSAATPGTDVIAMPSTTRTGTRARQAGPWCLTTEPKRNRGAVSAGKWSAVRPETSLLASGRRLPARPLRAPNAGQETPSQPEHEVAPDGREQHHLLGQEADDGVAVLLF